MRPKHLPLNDLKLGGAPLLAECLEIHLIQPDPRSDLLVDDLADHSILLWSDIADFCSSEFIDFADFAVGDGAGVYDRNSGRNTRSGDDRSLVCDNYSAISY